MERNEKERALKKLPSREERGHMSVLNQRESVNGNEKKEKKIFEKKEKKERNFK